MQHDKPRFERNNFNRWLWGTLSLKRVLRSMVLIYAIASIYLFFAADGMIFVPPPASYSDTSEILKLTTRDGIKISALYLPHSNARYTLLYSHGNAEDLGQIRPVLEMIHAAGFGVFAYDYRGYGTSQGRATEAGTYLDIDAAYRYLMQQLRLSPTQLIAYGRSVGGGPSTHLAVQNPVAGLILESTFVSAFRVVLPISILPFDKFPNLGRLKQFRHPVLIIHGSYDQTIPLWHGKELYGAANEPKHYWWVEGADHNDLVEVGGDRYSNVLKEFADQLL